MEAHMCLKWFVLGLLVVQNGVTPLLFRNAMTAATAAERFDTLQAVTTQEAFKLLMSLLLYYMENGYSFPDFCSGLRNGMVGKPVETAKLAIPALLYFVQNNCLQLASANLPAAIFQVTYQGKTLVVAICSVFMLSKKLSRSKWLAICIMAAGLAVVQLSKSTESKQSRMANASEQSITLGLIYVLIGCFCSGFAGVYFEKMMKRPTSGGAGNTTEKPSMWLRNIQLAMFSCAIGATNMVVT